MSTSKEVANWQQVMADAAKKAVAAERSPISNLTIKSGILKYMDEPVKGNALDVVVLFGLKDYQFYDKPYDMSAETNTPLCFAVGEDAASMRPHAQAERPQSELCETCPHFQWGSDPRGGKGKACKEKRRLAVIPADALKDPASLAKAEVASFRVPVTSVKNYAKFLATVAAAHMRPPWGVVTMLSVHPHEKYQFEVRFEPKSLVPDNCLGGVHELSERMLTAFVQSYTDDETAEKSEPAKGKKYA